MQTCVKRGKNVGASQRYQEFTSRKKKKVVIIKRYSFLCHTLLWWGDITSLWNCGRQSAHCSFHEQLVNKYGTLLGR
jgi:hypothetical protein